MKYILLILFITSIFYLYKNKNEHFIDTSKYILKSKIPKCAPSIDRSKYILKSKIPKCAPSIDRSKYILKSKIHRHRLLSKNQTTSNKNKNQNQTTSNKNKNQNQKVLPEPHNNVSTYYNY